MNNSLKEKLTANIQKLKLIAKHIAQRLPKDTNIADAEKYATEYRKAFQDFEEEKETFGGAGTC